MCYYRFLMANDFYERIAVRVMLSLLMLVIVVGSLTSTKISFPERPLNFTSRSFKDLTFDSKLVRLDFGRFETAGYFDWSSLPMYPDSLMKNSMQMLRTNLLGNPHSESPSSEHSTDIIEELRHSIPTFFNTDLRTYTVVFQFDKEQAIRTISEALPKELAHEVLYSSSSNKALLDSQKCFNKTTPIKILDSDSDLDYEDDYRRAYLFPLVDEFNGDVMSKEDLCKISTNPKLFAIADASQYITVRHLNLTETPLDAVVIDLEVSVGYPSISLLLFKSDYFLSLTKPYFGGGTLVYALTNSSFEKFRMKPAERFEDGTLPFLTIASIDIAVDFLKSMSITEMISRKLRNTEYLRKKLMELNQCEVYSPEGSNALTFNLKGVDTAIIVRKALERKFYVVDGCHSTPGTCRKVTDGKGAVRLSVGWATKEEEIDAFIKFLQDTFIP